MEKALDASSGATPARSVVEALADKFTYAHCLLEEFHSLSALTFSSSSEQ